MTLPSSALVTNAFLYGITDSESPPSDLVNNSFIRDPNLYPNTAISINTAEFMDVGAGRFALGSQFAIVQDFFQGKTDSLFNNIAPNSDGARRLTKSNFVSGWQGLGGSGSFGLFVYQSDVQDDYDDYIERSYVWNSTSFKLSNSVTFVVNADGTKSIENYSILPWFQDRGKDGFDFESDEPKAKLINPILKKTIDPSGIGRTVDLVFDNTPVPTRTYTSDSFLADQREVSSWSGADPSLVTQGKALVDDLFDKGISRFLDKSDNPRPIFYGTTGNDVLSEKTAESSLTDVFISKIKPYQKNGLVLIGGDGDDEITGGGNSDRLLGGDGDDILFGGRMQDGYSSGSPDSEPQVIDNSDKDDGKKDILEGGKGSDTYYVNSRYSVDSALSVSDGSTAVAGLEASPIDTILDSDGNGKVVLRFDYSEKNENGVNTDIARYGESITLSGVWDRKDELDKYYGGEVYTWAASENFDLVGALAENGSLYIFNQFNDHGNYALAEIKNFGSATGGGSSGAFLGISLSGGNPSGNGSGTGTGTGSGSGGTGTGTGSGSGGTGTGTGNGSGNTGTGTGNGSGNTGTGTGNGSGDTGTGTGNGSGDTGTGTGNGSGGSSGTVTLAGTDGADRLVGTPAADVISGGKGDDYLSGGDGGDTYLYSRGDGSDTIDDNNWSGTAGDDRIVFGAGISQSDLSFSSYGTDLIIRIAGSSDQIRVSDGLYGAINNPNDGVDRIEKFVFADGSQLDMNTVQHGLLTGTDGNDNIIGYATADAITGGKGDDYLSGRGGGDTYLYNRGDGADVIDDNNWANTGDDDQIVFGAGISQSDLGFYRDGTNLIIKIAGTNDQIRVSDGLWAAINDPSNNVDRIERFVLAGGSQISMSTVEQNLLAADGGSNGGYVPGGGSGTGSGGAGTDNPPMGGGSGGGSGTPATGGAGGSGGGGAAGDPPASGAAGGSGGGTPSTGGSTGSGGTGGSSGGGSSPDAATLAGTDGADRLVGTPAADVISGGKGDDYLSGGDGGDTYLYSRGDGSDTIDDNNWSGTAGDDRIVFGAGISQSDLSFSSYGTDLIIRIAGSSDQIRVSDGLYGAINNPNDGVDRIEKFVFADGSQLDMNTVQHGLLTGTDGNDNIIGYATADAITGGKGDDYLSGRGGGDTYLYNRGDGADTIDDNNWANTGDDDQIVFGAGISQSDLSFSSYGTDLIIRIAGSSDQIRVSDGLYGAINNPNDGVDRIEKFVFADGSQLDMNTVQHGLLTGTDGNDSITGYATADAITGGKGDDYLSGRGGSDTYLYNRGDGADVIDDNNWANTGDDDQIVFGAGISQSDLEFYRDGTNLIIKIAGTNDQIRVSDGLWAAINDPSNNVDRIERLVFAGGSQISMSTIEQNLLATDGGSNGGDGSGTGSSGGGVNSPPMAGRQSRTRTMSASDVSETASAGEGSAENVPLGSDYDGRNDDSSITSDNATPTSNTDKKNALSSGTTGVERSGDNSVSASKATELSGTDGADNIHGFETDDIIVGGMGDDYLAGRGGADIFVFGPASGNDVISDFQGVGSEHDLIQFDHSIFADASSALAASAQVENDVVITISPQDTIVLKDTQLSALSTNDFRIA